MKQFLTPSAIFCTNTKTSRIAAAALSLRTIGLRRQYIVGIGPMGGTSARKASETVRRTRTERKRGGGNWEVRDAGKKEGKARRNELPSSPLPPEKEYSVVFIFVFHRKS